MRVIKGSGRQQLLKQEILAATTGQTTDPSSQFERLINSNTPDGRFLRRLLNPRPPKQTRVARRFTR